MSPFLTGYYFEIPSIGAIRINTQVRLWGGHLLLLMMSGMWATVW